MSQYGRLQKWTHLEGLQLCGFRMIKKKLKSKMYASTTSYS